MSETIGQQLKREREARGLTIQKVVQAIHIRAPHLEALEADEIESLPSPIQARAFLRLYAEYLGVSLDQAISGQQATIDGAPAPSSTAAPASIGQNAIQGNKDKPAPAEDSLFLNLLGSLIDGGKRILSSRAPETTSPGPVEQAGLKQSLDSADGAIEASPYSFEVDSRVLLEPVPSQLILNSIGRTLRQRRESLSLTLEEIERHTHIRKHYLQALEMGEFEQLPSSVQARGILNNYSRFLDLDVDALLLQYAESLQIQRLERQPAREQPSGKPGSRSSIKSRLSGRLPSSLQRYLSLDILFGGGLILLLLVFAIWGTSRVINLRSESNPQPNAPSISVFLRSSPESVLAPPSPTTTGNGSNLPLPPAGQTPVLTLPATGQGAVNVVVVAEQEAWVRVTVDGKVAFAGRAVAGTAYPYDGNTQIEVLTGNGIAISILYNQSNLGPMGNLGEVVDRIYTSKTILVPTSTFTPSPTITPTPTITLRPTATLRPSLTPRSSSTPTP